MCVLFTYYIINKYVIILSKILNTIEMKNGNSE